MVELIHILSHFKIKGQIVTVETFNSGHINRTYLVKTDVTNYVLQQLNEYVFNSPKKVIENKVLISKHLLKKTNRIQDVLTFVRTKNEQYFYTDTNLKTWNVMVFIPNSMVYEIVKTPEMAEKAGYITGEFLKLTSDFNSDLLHVTLPKFHSVKHRKIQFKQALKQANIKRLKTAETEIAFINEHYNQMLDLDEAYLTSNSKLRVTHNDTKLSNILFNTDTSNDAICIIDTDTIMPGLLAYDYGDAIRTMCNTAKEDEADSDKIFFNTHYFEAYTTGFINGLEDAVTKEEIRLLPKSIEILVYIMGLRFLTDFLMDDLYYKTDYPTHNLVRAQNQIHLLKDIIQNRKTIKNTFKNIL